MRFSTFKKKKLCDKTLRKRLYAEAWKWFSLYIKTRDRWTCVTCGKNLSDNRSQCHAGHYKHGVLDFNEININAQCLTAESKLRMFNGQSKSIADIVAGDELWAFNEIDYTLESATAEDVTSFVPDVMYEVELENGDKFYATAEHRVVANGEWVYIKDMLHNVSTYDILEL